MGTREAMIDAMWLSFAAQPGRKVYTFDEAATCKMFASAVLENVVGVVDIVFPEPEKWLREHMEHLRSRTDRVCIVRPAGSWDPDGETLYLDREASSGDRYSGRTMKDHVKALQLLCRQVGKTLHVGGIKNARDLVDIGNWDAEVVDAFWQLVFRGEVIYG